MGIKYLDYESKFHVFYTSPTLVDMTNVIQLLGPNYNIKKVVSGLNTAAILVNDKVFTWGMSRGGALGTGATLHVLPTLVEGIRNEIILDIDSGDDHMIALSNNGDIFEWGNLTWRNDISHTPLTVNISNVRRIKSIGAGNQHNHVLINDCDVFVWGSFDSVTYFPPQKVNVGRCGNIYSISSGFNLLVAAISYEESSLLLCVGDNSNYGCSSPELNPEQTFFSPQNPLFYLYNTSHDSLRFVYQNKFGTTLFIGRQISQVGRVMKYTNNVEYNFPVSTDIIKVPKFLENFRYPSAKIYGSYCSFTFVVDNEIYHLGLDFGHYTGNHRYYSVPKYIDLIYNPNTMSISNTHALNIDKNFNIFLWGVLYPFISPSPYPMNITSIIDFHCGLICSGTHYVIFTNSDGTKIYGYGKNKYGQLGLGDNVDRDYISQVDFELEEDDAIVSLKCGYYHTIALSKSGKVYGWGRGVEGQLGPSVTRTSNIPIQINYPFLNEIDSIYTGAYHTIIKDIDDNIYCFNTNSKVCCREENTRSSLINLPFDQPIKNISVGDFHNLFLTNDGLLYGCGINNIQQISSTHLDGSISLINEGSIQNKVIEKVWAYGLTSHALTSNGDIHIWGDSPYRYIIFQDDNHFSLSMVPNANIVPTKLNMDGDLINKLIIDVYGNTDVIIYKVEELPSSITCSDSETTECFINGTRDITKDNAINIISQNLFIRGKLILSNESIINITGNLDIYGTIYVIEDGCVEIKQSILQYYIEENNLPNINNRKHTIIRGCHNGNFSEVNIIVTTSSMRHSQKDCYEVSANQIKENDNLVIEFKLIQQCENPSASKNKIKWWGILLICIFISIALITAILIIMKLKKEGEFKNLVQ